MADLYSNTSELQNILDVANNLPSPGVDTSDATATAADILNGATAYANGEKLTGTAESTSAISISNGTVSNSGRTVIVSGVNGSAYINPNASTSVKGLPTTDSNVITKFIQTITITGDYQLSKYYNEDFGAQIAYINNTDCVLMMRGGSSSAYENIALSIILDSALGDITADEMEMTMYDSTNGSTERLYAAIIRKFDADKLYDISIDMCEIDSTNDCVYCDVTITFA